MKRLFIILFSLLSSSVFSQYAELTPFYWNTLSSINPANSGFDSKFTSSLQAYLSGTNENNLFSNRPYSIWANTDLKIDKLHGGLGLNYNRYENGRNSSNTLKLNYNYQIEFNENHRLSFGLSLGADHVYLSQIEDPYFLINNTDTRYAQAFSSYFFLPEYNLAPSASYTRAKVGGGLIYKYKKVEFGTSFTNHIETGQTYHQVASNEFDQEWNIYNVSLVHFYANYKFSLFRRLEMNPLIAYQSQTGSSYHSMMFNLNFILTERVLFGSQLAWNMSNVEFVYFLFGVKISEKFRLNYSYGSFVGRYTNQFLGRHLVGFTYAIQ